MEEELNLKELFYYFLDRYKKILKIAYYILGALTLYFLVFKLKGIIQTENITVINIIINSIKKIIIYAVISVILSCGYMFLVYYFDNSIKSEETILKKLKLKLFGIMLNKDDTSSLKNVKSNIYMNNKDAKVVLVARSNKETTQGKLVYNLAKEYANDSKRVIILDTDLYNNNIKKLFNVESTLGYTDIISDNADLKDTIINTDNEFIDIIVNGENKNDPIEIISDKENEKLIKELIKKYDLVLINSPSLLGTTGALELIKYSDIVLVDIENEKTLQNELKDSIELLDKNIPVAAVVTNVFESSKNYSDYSKNYYFNK